MDKENNIVTTPAFMCETKVHEIDDGIGKMIEAVMELSWPRLRYRRRGWL